MCGREGIEFIHPEAATHNARQVRRFICPPEAAIRDGIHRHGFWKLSKRVSAFSHLRGGKRYGKVYSAPASEPCPLRNRLMDAIVVIAASGGGLGPILRIVAALPTPCLATIFVVSHIGAYPSILPDLINLAGPLPAEHAFDGASIQPGHIYVAPPDHHMVLELGCVRLSHGPKVNHARPAADPLFLSAAELYGGRVIGIVLSGGDGDGAVGLRAIKAHGGTALVQDPGDAAVPSMPLAALAADHPDACLSVDEIAHLIGSICGSQSNLVRVEDDVQNRLTK